MAQRLKIVLASSSPRRQRLLEQLGFHFEAVDPGEVEEPAFRKPKEMAMANALAKAAKIAEQLDEGIVIGADTVVVRDGKTFAKAGDPSEAEEMLMALRGSIHQVFSGIAVVDAKTGKKESDVVETHVKMLPVSDDEIKRYVATGEPIGKAGGYAIQGLGAILIEEVHGCFYNVVGLPLSRLYGLLKRFEVNLLGLE